MKNLRAAKKKITRKAVIEAVEDSIVVSKPLPRKSKKHTAPDASPPSMAANPERAMESVVPTEWQIQQWAMGHIRQAFFLSQLRKLAADEYEKLIRYSKVLAKHNHLLDKSPATGLNGRQTTIGQLSYQLVLREIIEMDRRLRAIRQQKR